MNVRPLSAYDAAALGVSVPAKADGIRSQPMLGEANTPAIELTNTFLFQSYFDNTLLQNALLAQPPNAPIVPSTLSLPINIAGYEVGLHPASETPIGIQFNTGGQQGASQVYRLAPGQWIRPFGRPGEKSGAFSGFQWGLPFGWLGGGSALLVVSCTADARFGWNSTPEIIFHRQRMKILAPASIPSTSALPYNWPKRFPWPRAVFLSGSTSILQGGSAALAITPTRTAMRLRMDTLASSPEMLAVFCGTNDFDLSSTGAVVTSAQTAEAINWQMWSQPVGAVNFTAIYQELMMTGALERYAADDGALVLVDNSGAGTLTDQYVDVVRYGKVG